MINSFRQIVRSASVEAGFRALKPAAWIIAGTFVLGLSASADEEKAIVPEDAQLGRPVDFAKDIFPILQANCIACHNKAKAESELNLESSDAIMKGGASGEVIVPGKPDESYLYNVAARVEESFMPPWPNEVQAKKLTPREVGLLRQWIIEGAKGGATGSAANMQWQAINSQLNAVYAVDTDPFGRFVAAGRTGNVNIYDLVVPENIASLTDPALAATGSAQQTAHRDYVHAIAFHPNGQMLATSGFQVVKLWTRNFQNVISAVANAGAAARTVTSPDGTIAAVHQTDGTIRVIDLAADSVLSDLSGQDPAMTTLLGIHGDEKQWLSTASADNSVRLVSRADGSEIAVSEALPGKPMEAIFVSAGNRLIVLLEDGSLLPLALNGEAKSLVAAEPVKSDKGPIKQLATAGNVLMCRIEGPAVELRNNESLQPAVQIQSGTALATAAISPDAERVVTVSTDGRPELWNAKDGKLIATLNNDLNATRHLARQTADKAVRDARVNVVKGQITEDEKRVAEQKESLKKAEEELKKATDAVAEAKKKLEEAVTKTTAAKEASEAKADDDALKKALEEATKAETAAKDAVTTAENALQSAEKGKLLSEQAIKRAEDKVADRKQLLAQAEEEAKQATEAQAAADAAAGQTVTSALAAFVGTKLVATVDPTGATRLWKATDGAAVDVLPGSLAEPARPVAVHGGTDGLLLLQADGQLSHLHAFPQWTLTRSLGPQGENGESVFVDRVLALAFSPDGKILAAGGGEASRNGEVTLWNVDEGSLLRTFEDAHSDTVYGLDFSADGKLLATAAADKFVKVFDVSTGEHIRSYEGHTHHVMDVSWKGDRTQLASAGADNAIKVWDAETGEQARTISTHQKQVTALEFIGMEDDFISCSGDKRIFRHKASNGGKVREFSGCPDYVYCSATTADGSIVAAGCEDGILRVWNGADGKQLATFAPPQ
ncbi:MAG: c-type cytochrome domain-containing protein [Fuerstiella sp.]